MSRRAAFRRFGFYRARGMTLMEVLIATGILVFGLVSVMAALQTGLRTHARALHENNAALVGASVMAELRSIFARGTQPHGISELTPQESADFPGYKFAVAIKDISGAHGVRGGPDLGREFFVEVKVTWGDHPEERKWIVFNTVMFLRTEQ
ncbi:MAG: hypothetical protein HY291_03450 [Planctomycetes bacterium]|nr:hypothetical protein [Planctomycetota bacterium]